jgi:hypothetical protein
VKGEHWVVYWLIDVSDMVLTSYRAYGNERREGDIRTSRLRSGEKTNGGSEAPFIPKLNSPHIFEACA